MEEYCMKRSIFISILAAVLAIGGIIGFIIGQAPVVAGDPADTALAQAAVGTSFTYQGRLTGSSGPISDTCDFTFGLWDAASGGNQVGTVNKNGVTVSDGLFTVQLDFGAGAFTGDARWLAISVDCGDGAQSLTPRQPLQAAPYALSLMPGAAVQGTLNNSGVISLTNSADDGLRVESAAGDGVQVTSAAYGFYVQQATVDGLLIDGADNDGVHINRAESDGVYVASANYGVSVASSDTDGIFVNNADADGNGIGIAGYFDGDVRVTEHLTATNLYAVNKNFVIDHPQDPENKYLYHSSVESPDRMNVYNGNVTTNDEGYATVALPDYFEALNHDYRYQLTVIGAFAQAVVAQEIEGNQFTIQTDEPNVKVSWQVTGIRDDASARANPMRVEVEKPDSKKGLYLDPAAHGQPESQRIGTAERAEEDASQ
jgi:hypothetical protein